MSKAQKGNKEKKKPKADKNQPKTRVSAYKAAQGEGKPSLQPVREKVLRLDSVSRSRTDRLLVCWTRRTVPSVPVGGVSYLVDTEPGMNWIAHYLDRRLSRDSISRAFASKEDALREACDLTRGSCVVHFIQGPNDEKIDAVAIAAWCKHHPWRRDPCRSRKSHPRGFAR